LPNSSYLETLT